jgi:hypothetical protein
MLGEVIAEKRNVRHGSNGFYDILLRRQSKQAMLIEVALSVFFRFIPNGADQSITWTQAERDSFVQEWLRQIPATWDKQNHTTYSGFNVSLAFNCNIRQEAENSQWQANVMKLKSRAAFRTSAVCLNCYPDNYDAKFDSNDDVEKPGGRRQTAMIHEFGHMVGQPDEYKSDSPHYEDKSSVMNLGAKVRDRHLTHLVNWAKPHIDDVTNPPKEEPNSVRQLRRIAEASTKEEEIAAAKAWRDGGGSDEGVHFVVRRRGTNDEIPLDKISLDGFENLEVEFSSADEEVGEVFVWEPQSREALEILFVE